MLQPAFFPSLRSVADRYDAFILDLWGVIHDGQQLYPNVRECLEELHRTGKRVVFLSNAPRRASVAGGLLTRLGIDPTLYDALITSGETAYRHLEREDNRFFDAAGTSYVYIGLEKDRNVLAGLPYREVAQPEDAKFVLLTHSYYDNQPMSELAPLLARCLSAGLPAICINPDMEIMRITGEHIYCAGVIAAGYEKMGGEVLYFGKPHHAVYEACCERLAGIDPSRIVAVGDNLATDIRGALSVGLASILVTGGVLRERLGIPGTPDYMAEADAVFAENRIHPEIVIPSFNW